MGSGRLSSAAEESAQAEDRIRDVDPVIVVGITGQYARNRAAAEQETEHGDRITDVISTILIGVSSIELIWSSAPIEREDLVEGSLEAGCRGDESFDDEISSEGGVSENGSSCPGQWDVKVEIATQRQGSCVGDIHGGPGVSGKIGIEDIECGIADVEINPQQR